MLQLITELHPAGAERVVAQLASGLERSRFELSVASLTSPGGDDGAIARELLSAGVPVTQLRLESKRDLAGLWRLVRLVRRTQPDLIHAHLFHANLAARLVGSALSVPVVSTHHVVERRAKRLRFSLERSTARLDRLTVAVSRAVGEHALAQLGARPERLRVVHNGIDLTRFAARPARESARAALDLPDEVYVIGAVGRLDRQKGFDTLLEAHARLPGSPWLVMVGQGPEEGPLRRQSRVLGTTDRVRFLGFRDDVPTVLAALDVFAMPSRWEGFGLALVEALAASVPVVTSSVDSLPEVLGEAGLLVPAEDPAALAAALGRLLAQPRLREELAERGPLQAARFSLPAMLAGYQAVYTEALELSAGRRHYEA